MTAAAVGPVLAILWLVWVVLVLVWLRKTYQGLKVLVRSLQSEVDQVKALIQARDSELSRFILQQGDIAPDLGQQQLGGAEQDGGSERGDGGEQDHAPKLFVEPVLRSPQGEGFSGTEVQQTEGGAYPFKHLGVADQFPHVEAQVAGQQEHGYYGREDTALFGGHCSPSLRGSTRLAAGGLVPPVTSPPAGGA